MSLINAQRSKAVVCLFFQWTSVGLLIYMSWVDDIMIAGKKEAVMRAKEQLKRHFTLDEQGELKEYVGCKIERSLADRWMKLTQPVMIQSFTDEFDLPTETTALPARVGEVLSKDDGVPVGKEEATKYRSGVGKILHMMKWSRHDILNRTRELSRFMSNPTNVHINCLYRLMNYVKQSATYGSFIQPNITWDGITKSFSVYHHGTQRF
jgi:hypothetical protein